MDSDGVAIGIWSPSFPHLHTPFLSFSAPSLISFLVSVDVILKHRVYLLSPPRRRKGSKAHKFVRNFVLFPLHPRLLCWSERRRLGVGGARERVRDRDRQRQRGTETERHRGRQRQRKRGREREGERQKCGCMVYTERAETAAASSDHVTTKTAVYIHHYGGYSKTQRGRQRGRQGDRGRETEGERERAQPKTSKTRGT